MNGLAVCQRCGKTFPRSILGLNVVVGKFERCPHCGKWQLTRRASPAEIELADSRNKPKTETLPEAKAEKDELEDSKFIDS
jgi:DNA-directed RNA polymerase subunit RPC12/RpoP